MDLAVVGVRSIELKHERRATEDKSEQAVSEG
jgi:hypothetical protein